METPPQLGARFGLYGLAAAPEFHRAPDADPHGHGGDDEHSEDTILIVDDEMLVVNIGQHILEDAGYHVIIASTGEEAVEIYTQRSADIDLVILDYVMPGMNGFETWQALVKINSDVRVLFWSGYLADGDVARLIADSSCDFIAKPYQIPDLLEKVSNLLRKNG